MKKEEFEIFFRREINLFALISVNFEQNLRLHIEVIVVTAHAFTSCKHRHVWWVLF
jgi:hypothetical protein